MRWFLAWWLVVATAASAQPVQTQTQALSDDAIQYAAQFGVTLDEALLRLRAQQASVAATDAIAREFAPRSALSQESRLFSGRARKPLMPPPSPRCASI
jgi:hypothetical protein